MIKDLIEKVQQNNYRKLFAYIKNLGLSTKFVNWKAIVCLLN